MSLYLNLDKFQHDNFTALAPHTSAWDVINQFTVSGVIDLPKPVYATLNNFLMRKRKPDVVS